MKRRISGGAYRREKMILTASGILVLTAMTVTGVYLYNAQQAKKPENNVVDFSALEEEAAKKEEAAEVENKSARNLTSGADGTGEMDYDPYYVEKDRLLNRQYGENSVPDEAREKSGSAAEQETGVPETAADGQASVGYSEMRQSDQGAVAVQPELTAQADGEAQAAQAAGEAQADGEAQAAGEAQTDGEAQAAGEDAAQALEAVADVAQEESSLHFSEESVLTWPIAGNVLLNYSMDRTIFFPTLQQYKYNPTIVIAATQGMNVACAADGIVTSVYEDAQTGTTVVMKLGDGYELRYGQLEEIAVEEGDFVETGVSIGKVSAPTKYYIQEGTNVCFALTKDGEPVNPLDYLE